MLMEEICDMGKAFGASLTDLSKAFDSLDHEFPIAKLSAYGLSQSALRLTHDYLPIGNKEQKLTVLTGNG